jgi:hypothetical protein
MAENKANREYKNSVFVALCEDKKRLIEIYNAVSNKNYPPDAALKIVTQENVLFMGRRSDVAFLLEDRLVVLFEHQSSVCENMPVRLFIYLGGVYEKWLNADEKIKQAVYGTKLLKIPQPEFYVFYNGRADFPERKDLKLSDAFQNIWEGEKSGGLRGLGGFLELVVPIYNMNPGFNKEIQRKSETLSGYASFVDLARRNIDAGRELEEAIRLTVEDCIGKGILVDFLRTHSSEVINMLTAEFKLEDALQVREKEGIEKGIAKGITQGIAKGIAQGIEKGIAQGIEKGIAQGIEKGKIEVARSMLADGFTFETVKKYTGLNAKDVLSLR